MDSFFPGMDVDGAIDPYSCSTWYKLQEWSTKSRTEIGEENKEGQSAILGNRSLPVIVEVVDHITEIKEKPVENKKRRRSPSVISSASNSDIDKG